MKNWLSGVIREEAGLVLPAVLAMMALGSLMIVPMLKFVSTSLNAGETVQKKVEGLYAADAGIEDALWKLKNEKPSDFPYSYDLPANLNEMSVSILIEIPDTLFDQPVEPGGHVDWMEVTKSVSYNSELGIYFYTMSLTNKTIPASDIKLEMILIDLPPDLEYEVGSTGGDFTSDDPDVNGDPITGITLVWEFSAPYPTLEPGPDHENGQYNTEVLTFQLSGPPDVEGVEGHGFIRARRQDVGEVWDSESTYPYSITAQAKDADEAVVATIEAGVWQGSNGEIFITYWEINP